MDLKQRIELAKRDGWTQIHEHGGKLWGIVPNAEEFDSQGALENYYEIPDFNGEMTLDEFRAATPKIQADYLAKKLELDDEYREKVRKVMEWAKKDAERNNNL